MLDWSLMGGADQFHVLPIRGDGEAPLCGGGAADFVPPVVGGAGLVPESAWSELVDGPALYLGLVAKAPSPVVTVTFS